VEAGKLKLQRFRACFFFGLLCGAGGGPWSFSFREKKSETAPPMPMARRMAEPVSCASFFSLSIIILLDYSRDRGKGGSVVRLISRFNLDRIHLSLSIFSFISSACLLVPMISILSILASSGATLK